MVISQGCHLIAVTGGKGGVGKSIFSANFSFTLMMELHTQVLLIDADAKSCGDQNVILGVRPNKTVADVAGFTGPLNPQTIPQLVTNHPSGLGFIGAVRGPDEKLTGNPDSFLRQLEFLSRTYKFIVVDLGGDIQSIQQSLLQEATVVIIVTAPEILVVNQTHRLIQEMLAATLPIDMLQLVINKVSNQTMKVQGIAQTLRIQSLGSIPFDEKTVSNSLQRSTPFILSNNKAPISMAYHEIVRKLTGGILQRLKTLQKSPSATFLSDVTMVAGVSSSKDEVDFRTALKIRVHNELIKTMDLKKGVTDTQGDKVKEEALRQKTQAQITALIDKGSPGLARQERSKIIKEVLDEALGLGVLEDLLVDPSITEIMVNGAKKIFIEKGGKVQLSPVTFTSNLHLRNIIERIVTPLGRRIDEKTPYVDARLKDGSRVNAVIEPLSLDGPALTIRKFKKGGFSAEKYIEYGSMTQTMIDLLRICVENKLNIVVSGGTGSGKTSLLNMISGFIPGNSRVVTVEDAAELQMRQEHVVRLETRPPNVEGSGAVTIRDLVRNALRMRPDRIVIGETRDGAAMDMLQAMNTGHEGSMTTTHANSPRECIGRLETLSMMSGLDLPVRAIREQIASAIHLIIQTQRLSDGSRKVTSITEVCGVQGETVALQEIFFFKQTGFDKNRKVQGYFQASGVIPSFVNEFEQRGIPIPRDIFSDESTTIPIAAEGMGSLTRKTGSTGGKT